MWIKADECHLGLIKKYLKQSGVSRLNKRTVVLAIETLFTQFLYQEYLGSLAE